MKAFQALTVRGQASRLRRLASNALAQYDLPVSRMRLVTNDFNGIFRLETRPGEKYILRVTLPEGGHNQAHVTAEMDWLAALGRDTRLSLPRPLPARNGALVVEAAAPGVPQPRLVGIFSWVPGRVLAKAMSLANVERWGRLMAGLHEHALTYQPPAGLDLLRFDRVFPFPEPVILFETGFAALVPETRRVIFERAAAWVKASIERLQASGEAMRVIHGDLHQNNVLNYRGRLSPIDFEDLMLGWPVQDIGTTFYYLLSQEGYPTLRAAFQAGYTRVTAWPERVPGEIDAFIAARGLGLVNFILTDPNPNWKNQAAGFIARVEQRIKEFLEQWQPA